MNNRKLITFSNWRYREFITLNGRYPDKYELLPRWNDDENPAGKNESLPSHNQWGYAIAYLQVYAQDSRALSRGDWDGGEYTLCAECAETEILRWDADSNDGLYPMHEMNGELETDDRVVRCDNCQSIIVDAETLGIDYWRSDESPHDREPLTVSDDTSYRELEGGYQRYDASDYETALADAEQLAADIAAENPAAWYVRLIDVERHFSRGENWPMETVFYTDSNRYHIERALAAGQSAFPGFPEYQPWKPDYDWSRRHDWRNRQPVPEIVGSEHDPSQTLLTP